uniref:vascular cell adhesion protein 1-like n=1 Tax=Pristiophorus japonicus TaxID=55135 RepID=UPI00398E34BD
MDFRLTSRFGYICLFTMFFAVTGIVAGVETWINANPAAVAFGDSLVVNCSTTCATEPTIVIEGIRDNHPKSGAQWKTHSSSSIQSWATRVTCAVLCLPNGSVTNRQTMTVYNRELNITSPPEVLEINKTYSLECTGPRVYPNNKLILTWLRGSEIIQSNSTGEPGLPDEDNRLRNVFSFTASTSDDRQEYTCLAEVDLGSNTTKPIANSSVTLQTYYKPTGTIVSANNKSISESPVHFSNGDSIILICDSQGNPQPTLKWDYPQKSNIVINPSGVLHISDATAENNGIYKCTAANKLGADEKNVYIKVKGIVAGVETWINANPAAVAFGDSLVVNCSTTCATEPTIVIEGIRDNHPKSGAQWKTHSSSSIQSWATRVTCAVLCLPNDLVTNRQTMTVYNRELNITSPPEVLEINKTYSLECTGPRVYPNNKLILTWLRGSEIVQSNSTGEPGLPDEDNRLRNVFSFTASTSDDRQEYTCLAEVDLGSNTTKPIANSSVTLQTYYKPTGTIISANNKSISESPVHFSNGDSIILICDSQGNPQPTLKWDYPQKSNIVINPSGVLHISDATAENNGIYKCTAANKLGADEKNVYIKVKDITAIIAAASVTVVATFALATGAIIYYLYRNAQKTGEYKLRNAKPNNNPQVPNENEYQ